MPPPVCDRPGVIRLRRTALARRFHASVGESAGVRPACVGEGATWPGADLAWTCKTPEPSPYQLEWNHLIDAIRTDKPYNEVKRGAEASLVTAMGRMAAHTGQIITFDDMLNCQHEFAPNVDKLVVDGPAPILADKDGKYPVPQPGINVDTEYALPKK